uniref:Uncharacterized protein n=1 Tax=Anguilla anguilla TaxID=7936 RepID=A0A0E9PHF1_ANGAN
MNKLLNLFFFFAVESTHKQNSKL